ncbi:hypothetical protein HQ529_00440 [Candidatus Woesearchaeota archaeon]|nr:hypothetical protein [Candidatus Woesearchaeota archaeon]
MTTEMITLKLESKFLREIDNTVRNSNYHNRTEFIREAMRNKLSEIEKQIAIEGLAKLKGSMKGKIKRLTKDELDELAYKHMEEIKQGRDVFKELGL